MAVTGLQIGAELHSIADTTSQGITGSSSNIWQEWIRSSASTTVEFHNHNVWVQWVGSATNIVTYTNAASGSVTDTVYSVWAQQVDLSKLSKEQRQALQLQQEQQEAARRVEREANERIYAAQRERFAAARERATRLLMQHLSEDQIAMWNARSCIHVRSQSGRLFEIKRGRAHNIFELNAQGKRIREYCVHVSTNCPDEDNVLAQKLALELNEAALFKVANKWELAA